jgi:hypothetical protein
MQAALLPVKYTLRYYEYFLNLSDLKGVWRVQSVSELWALGAKHFISF